MQAALLLPPSTLRCVPLLCVSTFVCRLRSFQQRQLIQQQGERRLRPAAPAVRRRGRGQRTGSLTGAVRVGFEYTCACRSCCVQPPALQQRARPNKRRQAASSPANRPFFFAQFTELWSEDIRPRGRQIGTAHAYTSHEQYERACRGGLGLAG
jgi:hypothetical protein